MYKLINSSITNESCGVTQVRGDTLVFIPFEPANTDYQAYLKFLEEGGVPEPADEPQQ